MNSVHSERAASNCSFNGSGEFTELWGHHIVNPNQVLYCPGTGKVILDGVFEDQTVDAVVVDIQSGMEKWRVAAGAYFAAVID